MLRPAEQEVLLTPAEVAALFRVDPKTVTRWAKAGKLTAIRTLGGHRRYRRSEVQSLLKSIPTSPQPNSNSAPAPTSSVTPPSHSVVNSDNSTVM
jgi:excisionase family DNA binding protein